MRVLIECAMVTQMARQQGTTRVLDDAKDKIREFTGLGPTKERLLKGIQKLSIPPRIKDHMRNMLTGRIKGGAFWNKVQGHGNRAFRSVCKKRQNIEVIETEEHLWLECSNSGQAQAWKFTKRIWRKTTNRNWPIITMGLIRGAAALSFEKDTSNDSERLRTLISMKISMSHMEIKN